MWREELLLNIVTDTTICDDSNSLHHSINCSENKTLTNLIDNIITGIEITDTTICDVNSPKNDTLYKYVSDALHLEIKKMYGYVYH